MRWVSAALVLLLSGCLFPDEAPATATPTVTSAPPPSYPLTLRFTQETADGPPLPDAEVYAVPREEVSPDPAKLPPPRSADNQGLVALSFRAPVTLLVQAFGPGKDGGGWTREGMVVQVGDTVTADRGLRAEGRTVTLPLLRAQLPFSVNATWGPVAATLAPNGSVVPAELRAAIPVAPHYMARLTAVRLELAWTQTPEAFGDLYAGLARGGTVLKGSDGFQAPLPGPQHEEAEGMPEGSGPLQAVALTNGAVQGELPLRFTGTLRFGGEWPRELPAPVCLAMDACSPLPQLPPL